MRFPIFCYQHEDNYKQSSKKIFQSLSFLSEKSIKALYEANTHYCNLPLRCLGLTGKSINSYQECMIQYIEDIDHEKLHRETIQFQQDQYKIKFQRWREKQREILNQANFWQKAKQTTTTASAIRAINIVHENWQQCQELIHYSSQALLCIAEEVLPVFENYLDMSKTELQYHQNNLPKSFYSSSSKYLLSLQKEIAKEKSQLCENFLLRLRIASETKIMSFDDPIFYFTWKLGELGIIKKMADGPTYTANRLNSNQFEKLHNFVLKNGSEKQKRQLFRYPWLTSSREYIIIKKEHTILIVPQLIYDHLNKQRFLQKIFSTQEFVEKVITQNFSLLCYLRALENTTIKPFVLREIELDHQWAVLNQLTESIKHQYQYIDKNIPNNFVTRLLFQHKWLFLNDWKKFLQHQHLFVLRKKINFVKYLCEQLNTRIIFSLDNTLINTTHFQNTIQSLMLSIEADIESIKLSQNEQQEWQNCLKTLNSVIQSAKDCKIADNNLSKQHFSQTLLHAEKITKAEKVESVAKELTPFQKIHKLATELSDGITCINQKVFTEHVNSLETLLTQLTSDKCLQIKKEIKPYIETIFINYLQQLTTCDNHEQLQDFLGKLIVNNLFEQFAPKYIRKRFIELRNLQHQSQWIIFQAKCYAEISALSQSKNNLRLINNFVDHICADEQRSKCT